VSGGLTRIFHRRRVEGPQSRAVVTPRALGEAIPHVLAHASSPETVALGLLCAASGNKRDWQSAIAPQRESITVKISKALDLQLDLGRYMRKTTLCEVVSILLFEFPE
jgi:hypothetical protein